MHIESKIVITAEDVAQVAEATTSHYGYGPPTQSPVNLKKRYGSVKGLNAPTAYATAEASVAYQSWFYLGLSGMLGAALAWALCEPGFIDGWDSGEKGYGNYLLIPLVVILMTVGISIAESIVERAPQKALVRGLLSLALGIPLGFIFYAIANLAFTFGLELVGDDPANPATWLVRSLGWAVFGVCGGLIYGIVGRSAKKCGYGVLGGMLGAAIGGLIFDPIGFVFGSGAVSRLVGISIVGLATGAAVGLVESALKERWLKVVGGPLAGKQFILYRPRTVIGSLQKSDIYLFKDPQIAPQHAVIELAGGQPALCSALAPVLVNGRPASQAALRDNDQIQIGGYLFAFHEKSRS